jgi:hypothetical protein
MMSDQEYVKAGGNKCPHCGSGQVSADSGVEVEGATAWQEVGCGDCQETWHDVYKLIGWQTG